MHDDEEDGATTVARVPDELLRAAQTGDEGKNAGKHRKRPGDLAFVRCREDLIRQAVHVFHERHDLAGDWGRVREGRGEACRLRVMAGEFLGQEDDEGKRVVLRKEGRGPVTGAERAG